MKTKEINGFTHIAYAHHGFTPEEMTRRSAENYEWHDKRRSIRDISDQSFPKEILDQIIMTASTAPSGAHKQPWTFCVISNSKLKKEIRIAAEEEEKVNYTGRMSEPWQEDLRPFATHWQKSFLEKAPYLVAVFKRAYEVDDDGQKHNNYYVNESVGIACGMLISAIHHAGLVTLTHTPSPMNFLTKILHRPENERPFLLLPVGYPADDAYVPKLARKGLGEVIAYY